MKQFSILLISALLLAVPAFSTVYSFEDDCEAERLANNYPLHYCDCDYQTEVLRNRIGRLPFDITITDTTWYKVSSSLFLEGFTAYLYSSCDVKLMIMQNCFNDSSAKIYREFVVSSNQARDVNADDLAQIIEEQGFAGSSMVLRLCIAPAEVGVESRFICTPYNEGPASTCSDCFTLLPGMVFVSSHSNDVYMFDATTISSDSVDVEWFQTDNPTDLYITRGTCDGEPIVETFLMPGERYTFDASLLSDLRSSGDKLYVHFDHMPGTTGRIRLNVFDLTTSVDDLSVGASSARLVMGVDGMLYIVRGEERYTLTGQRL